MKSFPRNLLIVAAVAAAAMVAAQAHEGATGIVKQRMDAMSAMAKSAKAITKRLRAGQNLSANKADADRLKKLAGKVAALFPAGSLGPHSAARDEIWKNWPDFTAKANALAVETAKLVEVATGDVESLRRQMQAVGKACGACHEDYRIKKN